MHRQPAKTPIVNVLGTSLVLGAFVAQTTATRPVAPFGQPRRLAQLAMATFIVTGAVAGSSLAWAAFSAKPSAEANSFSAGTLAIPGTPATIHPNVTGSADGAVELTWSASLSRPVTVLVQRAAASTPTTWSTVNGAGSGQSGSTLCTGSVPGTVSCSYLDNAANSTPAPLYNQQYVYQVVDAIGGWSSGSGGALAQSLAPTSGTDTSLVTPTFNAVSASSTTAIWAVGQSCTVDYSNGTTWTPQTVPSAVCPTATSLNGVDADGGSPMVVGANGVTFICTASCTTAAPTWSSKSTSSLGSPTLNAVSAKGSSSMWAVGPNCTALAYNGTSWASLTVPTTDCTTGTTLNGVSNNNGNPIFVGNNATLFLCSGGNCLTSPTWTKPSISGLSGSPNLYGASYSGGTSWAVGAAGTVAVCTTGCNNTGSTWAAQSSGTTNALFGVSAEGSNLIYASGTGGTIVKCTSNCNQSGTAWTAVTSNTTANFFGITAPSSSTAWAAGGTGTIDVLSGGTFGTQTSGLSAGAMSYTLGGTDLSNLSAPDSSLYTDQAPWPSGSLPASCASSSAGLLLKGSPVIPSGSWAVSTAVATVVLQANATPGTGASFALLVSGNSGSTWTSYALTSPGSGGASAQTSVSVLATVPSTTALAGMQLCLVGTSGSGTPLTSSIDLVHMDVN